MKMYLLGNYDFVLKFLYKMKIDCFYLIFYWKDVFMKGLLKLIF